MGAKFPICLPFIWKESGLQQSIVSFANLLIKQMCSEKLRRITFFTSSCLGK